MWSRIIEILLGAWLITSPFVLNFPPSELGWWISDVGAGALIIGFALLSFWRPTRFAHLLSILVGCWLIGFAYIQGFGTNPPVSQNDLVVGLLLLMFAVIPNQASHPPDSWEQHRLPS